MKVRILSAIVMLLVFIPLLIIGGRPYALLMAALSVAGLYEMIHIRESRKPFPLVMKVFAYILVLLCCLMNADSVLFTTKLDYRVITFIIFVFLIPIVVFQDSKTYSINDAFFLLGSILFVGMSFNVLLITRNYSLDYVIFLFLITIMTDTFAYFTGLLIGRHKLLEKVSPKKTIEGMIGGTLMAVIIASTYYHVIINSSLSIVTLVLVTLVLSLIGQIGDLVFSAIKRYYNQKDFSNLIPGHGGILDRLDSIIFVVLAFILFIEIL